MKRIALLLSALALAFAGCNAQTKTQNTSNKQQTKHTNMLVVYFSHSGNTAVVAKQIQQIAGADIFELKPLKAYPTDYNAVVKQAAQEVRASFHPELQSMPKDISKYDVIFVGSPCWCGTVAPPLATLLNSFDLSGKTIVPFMTHEGSGMGSSETDIKTLCPKSKVLKGLPIRGSKVSGAKKDVEKWLKELGLTK